MDDSFDNDYELVPHLPNQHAFCLVLSYAYDYHLAVAKFQQLSKEALKSLNRSSAKLLHKLCKEDADFVEMFKLISTMRGLGFRSEKVKFDIEFPTRNHLKLMLARLISKRRRQVQFGMFDMSEQGSTAIISSTDFCDEKVVSALCKVMQPGESEREDLLTTQPFNRFGATTTNGFGQTTSGGSRFAGISSGVGVAAATSRRKQLELEKEMQSRNLEQEIVMSTWINEIDLQMKSYDIVSLMRNADDLHVQAQKINNENFNIAPGVETIRVLQNPKLRYKALSCVASLNGEARLTEELNKVRARCYASDHRDNQIDIKIPPGYKIIGVKGFKNTNDGVVLHVADFIIWKPTPGWLDISHHNSADKLKLKLRNQ